jgi:hypothetical protein
MTGWDVLANQLINGLNSATQVTETDNPGLELLKMTMRILGWTALILGAGVYLIFWFIFRVVTGGWR